MLAKKGRPLARVEDLARYSDPENFTSVKHQSEVMPERPFLALCGHARSQGEGQLRL